jgi:hypothetical protein
VPPAFHPEPLPDFAPQPVPVELNSKAATYAEACGAKSKVTTTLLVMLHIIRASVNSGMDARTVRRRRLRSILKFASTRCTLNTT